MALWKQLSSVHVLNGIRFKEQNEQKNWCFFEVILWALPFQIIICNMQMPMDVRHMVYTENTSMTGVARVFHKANSNVKSDVSAK